MENEQKQDGAGTDGAASSVERRVRVPVYIESLAHRMCWRYKKSQDPHHSDTYTFNAQTLKDFAERLIQEEREACAMDIDALGFDDRGMVKHCAEAVRERSNVKITCASQCGLAQRNAASSASGSSEG